MSIEMGGTSNEIRHIEGEEPVAVETTRISLRQHKGLGDLAIGIDVTEIGTREEPVVTAGTEYYPARVCAPVVERFCVVRVCFSHGAALSCREIEQIEISLMMPDAELPVVGKRVAKETSVVGGAGE